MSRGNQELQGQPAFILAHGSFNPVHRQHLEMMVHARQRLEAAGFHVVRGILGITPRRRLLSKGAAAVADRHRLTALRIACDAVCGAEEPGSPAWLVPERRGVECGSGSQFVRTMSKALLTEAPGAVIFTLVGADTAVRYPGEMSKGPVVVVCRQGSTEDLHRVIAERGLLQCPHLYLTDELPGEECSSTKLREALERWDAVAVRGLCLDPVAEYLLAHGADLYAEQPDADADRRPQRHAGGGRRQPFAPPGRGDVRQGPREAKESRWKPHGQVGVPAGESLEEESRPVAGSEAVEPRGVPSNAGDTQAERAGQGRRRWNKTQI